MKISITLNARSAMAAASGLFLILLLAAAQATFTGETQFGDRLTIPVVWMDADLDGDLDLAVGNISVGNQLFINNGDGSFTDVSFELMNLPDGSTPVQVLPVFTWPDTGPDSVDGLVFYGAMLTQDMSGILGRGHDGLGGGPL